MTSPDRSKDIQPPPPGTSRQCECGKRMIVRVDTGNMHQGWAGWRWWCGCGHVVDGGRWHPLTAEEAARARWEEMNGPVADAAVAVDAPPRLVPADCKHERKTVADGGWTCDDCGYAGTIPPIGDFMTAMPEAWRRRWCDEPDCDCEGCAPSKGGLRFWGFTKDQWEAWVYEDSLRDIEVWTEGQLVDGSPVQPRHIATVRAPDFATAIEGYPGTERLHPSSEAAYAPLAAAIEAANVARTEAARISQERALAEWNAAVAKSALEAGTTQ